MNSLIYLSRNDIPFIEAQVNIHQPIINEISLIGEEDFHIGCRFLVFSKAQLSESDKIVLETKTDFEVFMSIMMKKDKIEYRDSAKKVLTLLFPDYQIQYTSSEIILQNEQGVGRINSLNFDIFKQHINNMFYLNDSGVGSGEVYNPADALAEKVAAKLNKRHQRLAELQGGNGNICILERYVSILTVGEQKDRNTLMQLTVAQLKDEFKRYKMKLDFDAYIQYKLAGAKDLDDNIEDWMKDFHS